VPKFRLQFARADKIKLSGSLRRRVVVFVDDKQVAVEDLSLASPDAKTKAVNRWKKEHGVDGSACRQELNRLSTDAEASRQEVETKRATAATPTLRVVELARQFIVAELNPIWHRKGKSLYCETIGREVPLSSLWGFVANTQIDAVAGTAEGWELTRDGESPDFRKRLALLKDGLVLAATQLIKTLPEQIDIEVDQTLDPQELQAALTAWLLKPRSYRTDVGTPITTSYFDFACGVVPGQGWQRCHADAVFARIDAGASQPTIAVKSALLIGELRYQSVKRLAADLQTVGFAETDQTIRVTGNVWRVWFLTKCVLDSIATKKREEPLQ
jgi:hypothetical protein